LRKVLVVSTDSLTKDVPLLLCVERELPLLGDGSEEEKGGLKRERRRRSFSFLLPSSPRSIHRLCDLSSDFLFFKGERLG